MMSSKLADKFLELRRTHRFEKKEDGFTEIQFLELFQSELSTFPSNDIVELSYQISNFIKYFKMTPIIPFKLISETNFLTSLYSLFMNDSLSYQFLTNITYILGIFIGPKNVECDIPFYSEESFIHRLIYFLQLPISPQYSIPTNVEPINNLVIQTINLLVYFFINHPNGKQIIFSYNINIIFEKQLMVSNNTKLISFASNFLIQILPFISNSEEKEFVISLVSNLIKTTNDTHSLTHLLNCLFLCMSENEQARIFLVSEGICEKCSEVIKNIKDIGNFTPWITIHAIKILALVGNVGNNDELTLLMNSNCFHSLFTYKYSFLDLSPTLRIDIDAFSPVCSFISGLILKNNELINSLFLDNNIIQHICNVINTGPFDKKICSMSVISSVIEIKNIQMYNIIIECNVISSILPLMSDASRELTHLFILFLNNLLDSFHGSLELLQNSGILNIFDSIYNEIDENCLEEFELTIKRFSE
ncbi:hypothetical protein TRFO_34632 [Tritrichomonas foetus]|uniref:Uncharacterized protein n=1 Tax=Tritrichomonas foetus TaxID=1144522 RepID=A0A1J4JIL6_9EUKA|nr:hypothetical protein TRFO_34632 [Tritrichomonas foetus]|eukprot:OHS98986.1 hypothetical protein TRFO_34632 [Tritrichomonas foetus]